MMLPRRPPADPEPSPETCAAMMSEEADSLAKRFNADYLHWDDMFYEDAGGCDMKLVWARMKDIRRSTCTRVSIGPLRLEFNITPDMQRILHKIDIRAWTGFFDDMPLDRRDMPMYVVDAEMDESIGSAQIGGASMDPEAAKKMLREGRSPRDPSEAMVANCMAAMKAVDEGLGQPATPGMIMSLHRAVSAGLTGSPDLEGRCRESDGYCVSDSYTGETVYTPPDYREVPEMVQGLCGFIESDDPFIHPVVKAAVAHYALARIHPFADCNGRTARCLFRWCVLRSGYRLMEFLPVSRIINGHRSDYYRSFQLSEADGNDITYFLRYILAMVEKTIGMFDSRLENEVVSRGGVSKLSAYPDLNSRQRMMVADMASTGRLTSVYELMTQYQVSYGTARNDLVYLQEKGLVEVGGKEGNKLLYVFHGKGS